MGLSWAQTRSLSCSSSKKRWTVFCPFFEKGAKGPAHWRCGRRRRHCGGDAVAADGGGGAHFGGDAVAADGAPARNALVTRHTRPHSTPLTRLSALPSRLSGVSGGAVPRGWARPRGWSQAHRESVQERPGTSSAMLRRHQYPAHQLVQHLLHLGGRRFDPPRPQMADHSRDRTNEGRAPAESR